jgi:hypothetical protein
VEQAFVFALLHIVGMTLVVSSPLRGGGARPPEAAALTSLAEKRGTAFARVFQRPMP